MRLKTYTALLLLSVTLMNINSAVAQMPTSAPTKEIVVVDLFARNRSVPVMYVDALREQVLAAFSERGRHRVIDAATSSALARPASAWGFVDPATAAENQRSFLQDRTQTMVDAGARYVITGAIADYKFEHVPISTGSKTPPKPGFRATFQVIISAHDLKLGEQIPDRVCTLRADALAPEEADMKAISSLRSQLEFYIDSNFKFETTILQLGAPTARKGIQELYIHCGSYMGVVSGDLFMVYEEVPIGNIMTRQKVGKLRVTNVENPEVARCKITKGDEEIVNAFNAGRLLICISDGKSFF